MIEAKLSEVGPGLQNRKTFFIYKDLVLQVRLYEISFRMARMLCYNFQLFRKTLIITGIMIVHVFAKYVILLHQNKGCLLDPYPYKILVIPA